MAYFPLFINLEEKPILVIGGGVIAERRIHSLLEFGCKIVIVSPDLTDKLRQLAEGGRIVWKKEEYSKDCLNRYVFANESAPWTFVLAAAPEYVNADVVRDCKELGILVNNASRKEDCDFYFPGLIKEKELVIGVTSGGSDHKFVAALSKRIRELVQKTWQV